MRLPPANQARCRDLAPDWESIDHLFHSGADPSRRAEHAARRICATCPVRRCCLEYAIALEIQPYVLTVSKGRPRQKDYKVSAEVTGRWGGVTARERASTRRMSLTERLHALEAIHAQKMETPVAIGG